MATVTRQTAMVVGVAVRPILRRNGRCYTAALLLIVLGFGARAVASEATPIGQFVNRVYRDDEGDHKYVVFVPAGYSAAKK